MCSHGCRRANRENFIVNVRPELAMATIRFFEIAKRLARSGAAWCRDPRRLRSTSRGARDGGFTILEVLVVITIIGLLIGLVAPAALRQLGGDAHLASDAAQSVFFALAQNAPRL